MKRIASVTRLGVVVGLAGGLLACGSKQVPCTGTGCYPIGGGYQVVFSPKIACADWAQPPVLDVPTMSVQESGSTVSIGLNVSISSAVHTLNGTENENGNISVTEPDTTMVLGIPYGEVNGSFVSLNTSGNQPPYEFTGTLTLIPTGADGTADGGTATGCSGSYSFTAQQTTDANGNSISPGNGTTDGG